MTISHRMQNNLRMNYFQPLIKMALRFEETDTDSTRDSEDEEIR